MKKKTSIILKIFILIITLSYMAYFIYDILNSEFILNNTLYIKTGLVLFNMFILIITLVSNNIGKITSVFNILIVLALIIIDFYPTSSDKKVVTQEHLLCTNDDISVNVFYTENKVNKIIYTHIFDDNDGAQNFVNKFDNQYLSFDSIYSEIIFGDNIEINLTYDLDNTDMNKLNEMYTYDLSNLKELKSNELDNYTCKRQD